MQTVGVTWLVYDYKHPDAPDITTWKNTTDFSAFFHGTLWYMVRNILEHNHLLPSTKNNELGHMTLEVVGAAGLYLSPHMYTSIHYAEPQVLFPDGVYW